MSPTSYDDGESLPDDIDPGRYAYFKCMQGKTARRSTTMDHALVNALRSANNAARADGDSAHTDDDAGTAAAHTDDDDASLEAPTVPVRLAGSDAWAYLCSNTNTCADVPTRCVHPGSSSEHGGTTAARTDDDDASSEASTVPDHSTRSIASGAEPRQDSRKRKSQRWLHLQPGGYECEELFEQLDDGSWRGVWHEDVFEDEAQLRAFVHSKRGNEDTLVEIDLPARAISIKRADSGVCMPTTTSATTPTAALQTERPLLESLQTERTQSGAKSKKKKSRKLAPGVVHTCSSAIRGRDGNAPIGSRVVMAIDFADNDRNHGGLVRAIEKTVDSLEGPYVEYWGKSGVGNDASVYQFISDTKAKSAPGGARGQCTPDILIVSGHGVDGHLSDGSGIGRWRLSAVAGEIVKLLPRVQVVVFALCNTNADKTIARELCKIKREGGPTLIGMQGKIDINERDGLVTDMVREAARVLPGEQIAPTIAGIAVRERKHLVNFA